MGLIGRFLRTMSGAVKRGRVTMLAGVSLGALAVFQYTYTSGYEGIRYKPYRDAIGVLTVCIGHTGSDIVLGKTYTRDECMDLFNKDLAEKVDGPLSVCMHPPAPLAPETVAAIRDFTFNVGPGNACSSTLMKKINAGDIAGACNEFRKWTSAGGKFLYGLQVRRVIGMGNNLSEADLCRSGL